MSELGRWCLDVCVRPGLHDCLFIEQSSMAVQDTNAVRDIHKK